MDEGVNLRKIIIGFLLLASFIIFALLLYQYFTTAQITITTKNPNDFVKISGILGERNAGYSSMALQELHERIKPGNYEIYVYGEHKSGGYSRLITVKARQKLYFNISPKEFVGSEPVYGQGSANVVADSSSLRFIEIGRNSLRSVGHDNKLSSILPGTGFIEAKWANPKLGLAKTADGFLYTISGKAAKPLNLPFDPSQYPNYSYDIARNGQIYLAANGNVYSGKGPGNFKEIYAGKNSLTVSAGLDKVAIFEKAPPPAADEGGIVNNQGNGHFLLMVLGSNKISTRTSGFNNLIWSPGGKYLLTTGNSGNEIFNDKLQDLGNANINNADMFAWLDDDNILYSTNGTSNQLWSYNINSRDSYEVSALSGDENIDAIYPDSGGDYVYLSVSSSNGDYLSRVGLKNQSVDDTLGNLSVFLPESVNGCFLNYINFSRPSILVTSPYGQDPLDCIGTAKEETQYYGVNVNILQFVP